MADLDIALPAEWMDTSDEADRDDVVVEYQHETAEDTTFIVSVMSKMADENYKVRLSTVNPTSTHLRHDYPVAEYDTVEDAVEGAEAFIEQLSQRLEEGSISTADPEIDAVRETIQTFKGDRFIPSVGRLVRQFT